MGSEEERISEALDAALEMTFPASDPIAVYMPEPKPDARASAVRGLAAHDASQFSAEG